MKGKRGAAGHEFGNAPTTIMEPPLVVLPDDQLFSRRALRLRELVMMVPALDEFLDFMARLAHAQHQVLAGREPAWCPAPDAFDQAFAHQMPPLGFRALRRDLDWRGDLAALLDALALHLGERQRPLLQALRACTAERLEAIADDVLEQRAGSTETRGLMPLVAAALQVAWVRLAAGLPRTPPRPQGEAKALCPCCGSPPAASIVHNEPQRSGVRYLHCALCATEWHLERVTCSNCDTGGQLLYLGLDDERGEPFLPVQAEACDACESYLKIVLRPLQGRADPIADDLASLALDLMLAEQGRYGRSGYNPLLVFDSAD